jgi:hypothetical protein
LWPIARITPPVRRANPLAGKGRAPYPEGQTNPRSKWGPTYPASWRGRLVEPQPWLVITLWPTSDPHFHRRATPILICCNVGASGARQGRPVAARVGNSTHLPQEQDWRPAIKRHPPARGQSARLALRHCVGAAVAPVRQQRQGPIQRLLSVASGMVAHGPEVTDRRPTRLHSPPSRNVAFSRTPRCCSCCEWRNMAGGAAAPCAAVTVSTAVLLVARSHHYCGTGRYRRPRPWCGTHCWTHTAGAEHVYYSSRQT